MPLLLPSKPAVPWLLSPLLLLEKARPGPVLSLGGAGVGESEERRQSKAPGSLPTWPLQVWGPRAKPVMMCPRGDLQSQGHSLKSVPRVWNSPPLFLKYSVSFHMSGIRRSKEQRERNRRQDRTGNLITGQRMPAAGVVVLLTRNADLATAGGALSGWPTVRRPVGKSQHPSLAS